MTKKKALEMIETAISASADFRLLRVRTREHIPEEITNALEKIDTLLIKIFDYVESELIKIEEDES